METKKKRKKVVVQKGFSEQRGKKLFEKIEMKSFRDGSDYQKIAHTGKKKLKTKKIRHAFISQNGKEFQKREKLS